MSLNECNTYISYLKVVINESNTFLFNLIEKLIPIIDERGERESIVRRKLEYISWSNFSNKFLKNPTIVLSIKLIVFVLCERISFQVLKIFVEQQTRNYKIFIQFDREIISRFERLSEMNVNFVKNVLEKCDAKPNPDLIRAITLELLQIFDNIFKSDRVTLNVDEVIVREIIEKHISDICSKFGFQNLVDFK